MENLSVKAEFATEFKLITTQDNEEKESDV